MIMSAWTDRLIAAVLVASALPGAGGAVQAQPLDRPMRAIHLSGNWGANRHHAVERWDPDGTEPLIPSDFAAHLQSLHVDWVGLSVGLHYDDSMDSTVERAYEPWRNVPTFEDHALRQLIRELRALDIDVYLTLCDGLLTYDMHYSSVTEDWFPWGTNLWEDLELDVVGISAWSRLAEAPPTTVLSVSALEQEYERLLLNHLEPLAAYNAGRPVVFLEYGAIDTVEGPAAPDGFPDVATFVFSDRNGNGILSFHMFDLLSDCQGRVAGGPSKTCQARRAGAGTGFANIVPKTGASDQVAV